MVESLRRKILKYKTDILNLEWETDSRDTNITDPILVSLEDRFGYNVKTDSIWYAFYKILKYSHVLSMAFFLRLGVLYLAIFPISTHIEEFWGCS